MRADPKGLNGGINLYAYARNNPLFYYDPLGLCAIPCCKNCKSEYWSETKAIDNKSFIEWDRDELFRYQRAKLQQALADNAHNAGMGNPCIPTLKFKVGAKIYEELIQEQECLYEICLDKDRWVQPKKIGCRNKLNTKPYWARTGSDDIIYTISGGELGEACERLINATSNWK